MGCMWSWSKALQLIFPPRETEKLVDTLSYETLAQFVAPTTHSSSHVISLLPYHHPSVQAVIQEAKYHRNKKAWKLLANVLDDFLPEFLQDMDTLSSSSYVLVPIPLSKKRLRQRGHNQVASVLKNITGMSVDTPIATTLLARVRDTTPQTTLTKKERLHNMRDAFTVLTPLSPTTLYVVIDDVITTGATLTSALHACKEAGASTVVGLALAH